MRLRLAKDRVIGALQRERLRQDGYIARLQGVLHNHGLPPPASPALSHKATLPAFGPSSNASSRPHTSAGAGAGLGAGAQPHPALPALHTFV